MSDMQPTALIDELAAFVAGAPEPALPKAALDAARWRILDVLGSALWGVHAGTAAAMRAVIEPQGGTPEATVLGRGRKLPALSASYLNSCASPALLDTCRFSVTHPGIVTVPAALAAAELVGASGSALMRAIVLGYEVMIRLGRAARPSDRGFVPTGVFGPLGAAAAAASLLGLNRDQCAHALALAATMGAGVLDAYAAVDGGRNQFGRACQAGLLAALLAREGALGNRRILEGGALQGTPGYLACIADGFDAARVINGLGVDYGITRVAPKIHDGCRYTNPAADAALLLVREHGLRADQVSSIDVRTFALALDVSVRRPTTVSGALFCMEFVIAVALLEGDVSTDKFSMQRLDDPKVRALMERISVGLDEAIDQAYPRELGLKMTIETVDGRRLVTQLAFPRGEPENPIDETTCVEKFTRLASPLIGSAGVDRIITHTRRLETLDELEPLLAACTPTER